MDRERRKPLAPGRPVTLSAANQAGQRFQIELSVDDGYMFTVRQTVANAGRGAVPVAAYGLVNRSGVSRHPTAGPSMSDRCRRTTARPITTSNFKTIDEAAHRFTTTGGWLGFTENTADRAGARPEAQLRRPVPRWCRFGRAYQADYTAAAQSCPRAVS
ncbi:YidC/Oxa1 family insertase periplasmic-domain containing protein [Sphingomonas sp. MMS24-JH45]